MQQSFQLNCSTFLYYNCKQDIQKAGDPGVIWKTQITFDCPQQVWLRTRNLWSLFSLKIQQYVQPLLKSFLYFLNCLWFSQFCWKICRQNLCIFLEYSPMVKESIFSQFSDVCSEPFQIYFQTNFCTFL